MEYLIPLSLFLLQAVYSYLSTHRMNESVGDSTYRYVSYCVANDLVKYVIMAVIAYQSVHGQWLIILTTVLGGAVGNTFGHITKRNIN